MNEPKVHGQIFDYMFKLKSYFGLLFCFGIVTTYQQWRIYWDSDAQDLATSDQIPKVPEDIEGFNLSTLPIPNWSNKDNTDSTEYHSPVVKISRRLKASQIYERNNPELISILASVVLKMLACPAVAVHGLVGRRAYIVLQPNSWIWGTLQPKELDYSKLPQASAQSFHLLHLLGTGAEGRVWLACSSGGKVCALKFMKDPSNNSAKRHLEKEAKLWGKLWRFAARVITLKDQDVLLMPYVKILGEDNLTDEHTAAAKRAITICAKLGYQHNDLAWRHVGFYTVTKKDTVEFHALFIDLSRVEMTSNIEEANKNMMAQLGL